MLKRLIATLVGLAILGAIAYDTWQYSSAQTKLRSTTLELATWAADNADQMSRSQVSAYVTTAGAKRGITVYLYDQSENGIRIWTQDEVPPTFALSTIANLIEGKPFKRARRAPMIIRDYREAGLK